MTGQLTIFDSMLYNIEGEIYELKSKIDEEQTTISYLDPNDYEDRNEIRTCNSMISGYQQEILSLEARKQELINSARSLQR
jgi:cell division protein FtsL